jgi:hypothetical protein
VWIIGTDRQLYRLQSGKWSPMGGMGVRVSAGAEGTVWVVNQAGDIYRWQNGSFQKLPGSATDVGANAQGDAWVVGITAGR